MIHDSGGIHFVLHLVCSLRQVVNHLHLHSIDDQLLLLQPLVGRIYLLVEELELGHIQVTILALSRHLLLQCLLPLLPALHLLLVLFGLLSFVIVLIILLLSLFLHQLVDHILQRWLGVLLFDLGPGLHDRVLEVHSELILA